MKKIITTAVLSLILGGCGLPTFTKPGATQQESSIDKYACARETLVTRGVAHSNAYAGFANVNTVVSRHGYGLCMEARGWTRE